MMMMRIKWPKVKTLHQKIFFLGPCLIERLMLGINSLGRQELSTQVDCFETFDFL